ncbi:MAG: TIGR02757 family protein [Spirochaetes bacterium]|nr:TIGR02757 family protein [Spirochaetota bacterium]
MLDKLFLEKLYSTYNSRSFIYSDPIMFLYSYSDPEDVEIAGLIASSLAYGRVAGILASVNKVLVKMKPAPSEFLKETPEQELLKLFSGFKHRFTTDTELADFLISIKRAVRTFGSLENCFVQGLNETDITIMPAMNLFVQKLLSLRSSPHYKSSLLPDPSRGSACKRLNMFLRWMVRKDQVDPGIWSTIPASGLIIPLDVHIYNISQKHGLTKRKSPDIKTAMEITGSFRSLNPEDPVKYDFAMTRPGILEEKELKQLLELSV